MKTNKQITRISLQNSETITDQLAIETEFDFIVNGKNEYTFFCSPENVEYLAIGYLYTHNKILSSKDIKTLDIKNKKISVEIFESLQTENIDNEEVTFSLALIKKSIKELNQKGDIFHATGCTHICGLLKENSIICYFEDISRHNAIYKTLGYGIQNNISLRDCALLLSCRITASIIDLVSATPVKVLCSQSAVSSLAVDKAKKAGKSVLGFIRQERVNLYTGNQRII